MLWRKAVESDEHNRGQLSAEFLRQNLIGLREATRSLPPRKPQALAMPEILSRQTNYPEPADDAEVGT
jgi:hypothetical protein